MAKNYEKLLEELEAAKTARKAARGNLNDFLAEKKLKKVDHSNHEDPKIAKAYNKLVAEVDKARANVEKLEVEVKESKPAPVKRAAKYNYPDDCTSKEDRKKFRATERAELRRVEKAEKKASEKGEKNADKKAPKKEEVSKKQEKTSKKADKKAEVKSDKKTSKKSKDSEEMAD